MLNKVICSDCGAVITGEQYETADGNIICETCYINDYTTCEECGQVIPRDEATEVHSRRYGDMFVCEDCLDNYEYCAMCNEYTDEGLTYVRGIGDVCESCLENSWDIHYCEECDEYVDDDHWNESQGCCTECERDSIITDYHAHKYDPLTFYGCVTRAGTAIVDKVTTSSNPLSAMQLGIEWEICTAYSSEHRDDIALKLNDILGGRVIGYEDDCSVHGFECVFQPHTYAGLMHPSIREAFDYAKRVGCSNDGCGLHVHISRTAFGDTFKEQADNIAKTLFLFRGKSYEKMVGLSRRSMSDARDWACEFINWASTKESALQYVNDFNGSHGIAVNCSNTHTVEFRLGKGTVDYDEMMSWVDVIVAVVEKSKTIDWNDVMDFNVWFEDADDELKQYMQARGVDLGTPVRLTSADYTDIIKRLLNNMNERAVSNGASTVDYNTLLYMANIPAEQRDALTLRMEGGCL